MANMSKWRNYLLHSKMKSVMIFMSEAGLYFHWMTDEEGHKIKVKISKEDVEIFIFFSFVLLTVIPAKGPESILRYQEISHCQVRSLMVLWLPEAIWL